MKKIIALLTLSIVISGCVSSRVVSVTSKQLQNQRFVLTTANGHAIVAGKQLPEILFNKDLDVSGKMCNRFAGRGQLSNGVLTVKHMRMTMMVCTDPQHNELDRTINTMLSKGAQVRVMDNQMILTTASQTLIYTHAMKVQ